MKIVADENIPYVREAFGALGEVITGPGRALAPEDVCGADLLLVRSITKVNAALLEGSSVRFVATATIGEDHVDKAYLERKGIAFSSAPGCNANSVADYITAALLELAHHFGFSLNGLTLGVVGVGNVGSRVVRRGEVLGMNCVLNDPPLARQTGAPTQPTGMPALPVKYQPIEAIYDCDVVTLHVPLTKEGPDATRHLVDEAFLQRLKRGVIVVNSARGAVVDNAALLRALEDGHVRACVLDVWEGEPNVSPALLEKSFIGTPHIAGYSFDGKVNGTRQIYEAACRFLGIAPAWDPAPLLPAPECPEVTIRGDGPDPEAALRSAVRAVYTIQRDDMAMRTLRDTPENERGPLFDRLRKEYLRRREFINTRAIVIPENAALQARLASLGFKP